MFPELTRDDVFRVETSRLWLRWARSRDTAAIHRMMNVKKIAEMTTTWPYPLVEGDVERRVFDMRKLNALGNGLQLVMTLKSEPDEIIGIVGGHFSLGDAFNIDYALDADYQGQGYATEALQAFMDAIFTLSNARKLIASVRIFNEPSRRVLVKSGFHANGAGLENMPARGGKMLSNKYVLTRARWNALKGWSEPIMDGLMIDIGINTLDAIPITPQMCETVFI